MLFAHAIMLAGVAGATGKDQIRHLALRALSEAWVRPRDLVGVCIDLIKRNSVVSEAIARANAEWPRRLTAAELCGVPGTAALAKCDPLLCCLLACAPITAIGFVERVWPNVPRPWLCGVSDGASDESLIDFCCAVARQCFLNGYVFATNDGKPRANKLFNCRRRSNVRCRPQGQPSAVVAGHCRLVHFAPLAVECGGAARALLAGVRGGRDSAEQVKRPCRRTPDCGGDSMLLDQDRWRRVARRAPPIRRKSLSALASRRAAGKAGDPRHL